MRRLEGATVYTKAILKSILRKFCVFRDNVAATGAYETLTKCRKTNNNGYFQADPTGYNSKSFELLDCVFMELFRTRKILIVLDFKPTKLQQNVRVSAFPPHVNAITLLDRTLYISVMQSINYLVEAHEFINSLQQPLTNYSIAWFVVYTVRLRTMGPIYFPVRNLFISMNYWLSLALN